MRCWTNSCEFDHTQSNTLWATIWNFKILVKKKKKKPKLEIHSQKTRNYPIKINKKHRSIYNYNIQIYASSQSRFTQALYQTRYE